MIKWALIITCLASLMWGYAYGYKQGRNAEERKTAWVSRDATDVYWYSETEFWRGQCYKYYPKDMGIRLIECPDFKAMTHEDRH